jgi:hypothetical protein
MQLSHVDSRHLSQRSGSFATYQCVHGLIKVNIVLRRNVASFSLQNTCMFGMKDVAKVFVTQGRVCDGRLFICLAI